MPPATDELGQYLGLEEPLTAVSTARLSDDAGWTPVTVGLTDRRLVCLAADGTFVSVNFDAISTVRGRQRGSLRYDWNETSLLLGAGAVVATGGLLAVAILAADTLAPTLAVTGLAALAATEYVRRYGADRLVDAVRETARRVGNRIQVEKPDRFEDRDGIDDRDRNEDRDPNEDQDPIEERGRGEDRDRGERYADSARGYANRAGDYADRVLEAAADVGDGTGRRRALLAAGAAVGGGSLLGAALVAGTPVVLPGIGAVLAGAGLADYAYRHRETDGRIGPAPERVRDVRVSTVGGRTVHLRSDPSTELDRDLGRLASVEAGEAVEVTAVASPQS